MENVVYLLGAGFSAPLGLPVMSNFLEKSKDMYFANMEKYDDFKYIYDLIRDISYLKNFINSDLHNIEEILSILEMGYFVGDNGKELDRYIKFLKDVISYYTPTPKLDRDKQDKGNWIHYCFGGNGPMSYYCWFIANLLQIKLCRSSERDYPDSKYYYSELADTSKSIQYSIITLNYDLVIENIIDFINSNYRLAGNMLFTTM